MRLSSGQAGPQAKVHTAPAEGDMRIRAAADVESEWVIKDDLIPICQQIPRR